MRILVVGVGGGGSNAVNRMLQAGPRGVEFAAVDSDVAALHRSAAPVRLALSEKLTRGLGAGGNPSMGERAAEESADSLFELCRGADLVLIVFGLGGGTGTGAAPVTAEIAQSCGALTIGVVTKPFAFEGARRREAAKQGLTKLQAKADVVIAIPSEQMPQLADTSCSIEAAFRLVEDFAGEAVRTIIQPVTQPAFVRVDLSDLRSMLRGGRLAIFARGDGVGSERAAKAAHATIRSPLSDPSMQDAHLALVTVRGGPDLAVHEFHTVIDVMRPAVAPHAYMLFGTVVDPTLQDTVQVGLIALLEPPRLPPTGPSTTFFRNPGSPGTPWDEPPAPSGVPRRPRPGSLSGAVEVDPPHPETGSEAEGPNG